MSDETGPLGFTDAHHVALGRMLIAFQHLETAITQAIILIVEPKPHLKKHFFLPRILEELSFSTRLRLLSNIVQTTGEDYFVSPGTKYEALRREELPELVAKICEGIALAEKSEVRRNQLVHSQWLGRGGVLYGPKDTVLRVKSRMKATKTILQDEYIRATDILSIVESMESAEKKISINAWILSGNITFNVPEDSPYPH